jgi:hypothetical protein
MCPAAGAADAAVTGRRKPGIIWVPSRCVKERRAGGCAITHRQPESALRFPSCLGERVDDDPLHRSELPERRFHGWRLLGVISVVLLLMAGVALAVDLAVVGPLEGRW